MRITLTRALAGHNAGATIERTTKVAQLLIAHGAAVEAEQPEPVTSGNAEPNKTKPKQTRRSASRKGNSDADDSAKATGKPAGQEGGGAPPPSAAPTAG